MWLCTIDVEVCKQITRLLDIYTKDAQNCEEFHQLKFQRLFLESTSTEIGDQKLANDVVRKNVDKESASGTQSEDFVILK